MHWAGSSVANVEVTQEYAPPTLIFQPLPGFVKSQYDSFRYDTPQLPSGFIWKMRVLSSCGDRHYVGLNGVELIDQFDMKVSQRAARGVWRVTWCVACDMCSSQVAITHEHQGRIYSSAAASSVSRSKHECRLFACPHSVGELKDCRCAAVL